MVGGVVSVASGGNAVQADVVQRLAVDGEAPDRDNRAALRHANDRKSRGFRQHSGHREGVGGLGADDRQAADDQTLATGLRPFEL